jgi:hypothetical protein
MLWLPYSSWTVEFPLDVDTLADGMRRRIERTRWFRKPWARNHTPLQGSIYARGFTATRVIHYRNSFLPVLYGQFIPHKQGTTIHIRMMLHPLVLLFLANWLGLAGVFTLIGLAVWIGGGDWIFPAIAGGMAAFAVLLTYGGFFAEATRTRELITSVFADIQREATAMPAAS